MKKLITVLLLLLFTAKSFSQDKKQQIETLTYKLDSINSLLLQAIDSNRVLNTTKIALESKISLLKKENSSKLNVGLCYSNHKTDEFQKYVLIQINNRLYELSINGYPYTITCDPDDNNLEITSKAEELSDFCENYNITEKLNQLLKVNFQGENFWVFWLLNESTNKIEVFSIIEGEGWDGKTELIGTFPYNLD